MYCSFDEEVLLCADSVVANVVAIAALDAELELPDLAPMERSRAADAAAFHAGATEHEPQFDETQSTGGDAGRIDAWARHARAANGFGV